MKNNGFHASTTGGKKLFAVVLIVALILAAVPMFSVFAAPGQPPTPTGNNSATVSSGQVRELQLAQAWYNSFKSQPGKFRDSVRIQQYMEQYAFALRQANALLVGRTNSTGQNNNSNSQANNANGQNNSSNGQSSNQTVNNFTGQQNMGWWLHMLRGLREKIAAAGGPGANSTFNGNNNSGIPVTGGSSNNNGSSTTNNSGSNTTNNSGSSSSNNSSSSTTSNSGSTTTTNSSGSTTTNNSGTTANSTVNNTSLAQTWGPQFRELQAAQAWLNNFKTQAGKMKTMSDQAKVQQYLDQYAFALKQANAIIAGSISSKGQGNNANGQSNFSSGLTNSQSDRTPAQQQLATWLHMMRSLRAKISGFDTTNSSGM